MDLFIRMVHGKRSEKSLGLEESKIVPPPKFNSEFSPEKLPGPNRKGSSSNHLFFRGELLNFGGVG